MILKWIGGKSGVLKELAQNLPDKFDTYIEPFLGGGALFWHLAKNKRFKRAILIDANEKLIDCYKAIKENPLDLITDLEILTNSYFDCDYEGKELVYYKVRNTFNKFSHPARFIFLNKTCFNGLYRENRKGEFNASWGKYKNPSFPSKEIILEAHGLLQGVTLISGDFEQAEEHIERDNTFIYLDPPYIKLNNGSFANYNSKEFGIKGQKRLYNFCLKIKPFTKILISNSGAEKTTEIFRNFHCQEIRAKRSVNCNGNDRGKVKEFLFTNYFKEEEQLCCF